MELFKEIFVQALISGDVEVVFKGRDSTVTEVIEGQCYQALEKIKAIIQDDNLDDPECFQKIEAIVCTLEEIGSNGGSRHDFG